MSAPAGIHSSDEWDEKEEPTAISRGGDRTYLYAGLGFGVVISLLVAGLMLKGENPQVEKAKQARREEAIRREAQEKIRKEFLAQKAEQEKLAAEALARISRNPDLDREMRLEALGRLLYEYATTRKAKDIAAAYDRIKRGGGTGAPGSIDPLEEKLARVRVLLAQGEPYKANLYLADEFTQEEQDRLGSRYDQLIQQCSDAVDKLAAEAEAKARALAQAKKFSEARRVLTEAQAKVDPQTREKLRELEQELIRE